MQPVAPHPTALTAARWLLFLNATFWLALGLAMLVGGSRMGLNSPAARWIILALMVGNAAIMLISGWGLGTGRRLFYFLALGVLAVNILLTFTDEFGPLDLLTLLIDLTILVLLLANWKRFLKYT